MIRDTIQSVIQRALDAAQAKKTLPTFAPPEIQISRPKQADHGDYSCNVAMVAAAGIRKETGAKVNPRQIAQAIVDEIQLGDLLQQVEIAGPGFINLQLADQWLQQQVPGILAQGDQFGNLDQGRGQRWQVEYVSANPTGPIHYGGARNAVLGDVLANVLEAGGYEVQREFYVNDGGSQFRLFIGTLYARYAQLLGQDIPIPADGYQGEYMREYAQRVIDEHGARFLALERTAAEQALVPIGRAMVLSELQEELGKIGVVFDNWFSEQSLYDEGLIEQSLAYLEQRGELAHRDGAVWFLASKYPKNEKDAVVVRSNGLPTYFAADIAYHYDKFLRRKFDHVINVWAVDHQGHVARMAAMMEAFGLDPARLEILMYDLVKLIRDGQEVQLSKRAGNLITINDVVDEVGADALRFNLMTRAPESTIDFDMDLAVQSTNENPVFYVQYGYARISSILERADDQLTDLPDATDPAILAQLVHPAELALIRKLLELEEQIELAIDKRSPHNLTHYVLDLAKTFSAFYRDCMVIDPTQPAISAARLQLCRATQNVIAKTLGLLGVSTPSTM